jgi:oligopeptide/dipeptide ABC transporter ATP-binding protein
MTLQTAEKPLLKIENLQKFFPVKGGLFQKEKVVVKAVDDVTFEVYPGETVGIVGESGCGKSTLAKTLLRLMDATDGKVVYNGQNINELNGTNMHDFRKDMQIIFQDPYSSLNPRKTVRQILEEPLINLTNYSKGERKAIIEKTIEDVGLNINHLNRFPHEFSGGQRQRIGIARALTVRPKLIVCDEAVSALDVSIQAQIINLLKNLQKKYQLTYIFISHDLGVVKHFCDRVVVMYLGKIVEIADKKSLFSQPSHPYTESLLSAVPSISTKRKRQVLKGEVPSPMNPPSGCYFHTRCPEATEECSKLSPQLKSIGNSQFVSCHLR